MKKAIIFDMDGVLVDSEFVYQEQLKAYLTMKGVIYSQEAVNALVGASFQEYDCFFRQHLGENLGIQEVFAEIEEQYGPIKNFKNIMFPNIIPLLNYLKKKGYQMAVASSSRMIDIEHITKEIEVSDFFTFYLSGEMFEESKPNPAIYLEALRRLNISADECMVIEDSTYGIKAAKGAGIKVIARKDNRFGFDQSQANYLIDDYLEVINILEQDHV